MSALPHHAYHTTYGAIPRDDDTRIRDRCKQRDDGAKLEVLRDADRECRGEHRHRRSEHQVANVH
jgi:hypothetical protein